MRKKFQRLTISAILLVLVFSLSIQPLSILAAEAESDTIEASSASLKIVTQPKSVAVPSGDTATVKVEAEGEGLTYQWYYKNTSHVKFYEATKFTTDTYSVEMSSARNGRQLYCVVTDKYGNTAKSDVVTIYMGNQATITKQPTSAVVASGKTAKVSLTATGDDLTYQWYYKNTTHSKFYLSDSVTSNTYSVTMNSSRNGRQLYCVVTDKYGISVQSDIVTISIPDAVKITGVQVNNVAPSGSAASVKIQAVGDGLTYKWYYKNTSQSKFYLSTSVTGDTYCVDMNSARNGRQIYCVVTDAYGNTAQSETYTLYMGNPLKITSQPVSAKAPAGKTTTVKVTASGDGLTYAWYYKNTSHAKFYLSESVVGNSYSVEMNSNRNGRQLYCIISDKYGNSVKTDVVTISIPDPVKITEQPESVTVVFGQTAAVNVNAIGEGLTYKWYYKNTNQSKFYLTTAFTGDTYSVEMTSARSGRQIYCVVTDQYGNSVKSDVVTISGVKGLTILKQPESVKAENGETATVKVEAVGVGLTYKWYYKNSGQSKFYLTTKFTGDTYSVTMSDARDGRQLYCVVTDKDGNSVKTNVVSISMPVTVQITKQPQSVTVLNGDTAKVSVGVVGDGLTYKWYYKNAGQSKFYLTTKYTSKTYSVTMSESRSGRQIYCVITDQYGNSVKTDVVTITGVDTLTIVQQPESVTVGNGETATVKVNAVGEGLKYQWYYKNVDNAKFYLTTKYTTNTYSVEMNSARDGRKLYCVISDQNGNTVKTVTVTISMIHTHTLGDWEIIREATPVKEGLKRAYCSCGYYEQESIAKVKAVRYLTVDMGNGETRKIPVGANGAYYLDEPCREGYNFVGWKDSSGNDFAASGTIAKNTKVYAKWEIDGTDTLGELYSRCAAGVDKILITGDIVVTKAIFVPYQTTIYSDGDYSITRSPGYSGDMFVVGQDKNGNISVVNNHQAILTLGGGKGTLTIDGNRDNLTTTVVGSAIYAADSCVINLYDGICISNHMKLGNARTVTHKDLYGDSTSLGVGGAAIFNYCSTVNMYGGVIENNKVHTEYSIVTNEDGTTSNFEYYGRGGAICNYGDFNMYGGIIRDNEALRGGGIYNARIVNIEAGYILDNLAHAYGGGIASSSSYTAETYLGNDGNSGTLILRGNHSVKAGGALYSATNSPIVIYGNTEFISNSTDSSGGAIYTSGGLTIRDAKFIGNSAVFSSGAVHHQCGTIERKPRYLEVTGCVFQENVSSTGGAMCLSAGSTEWGVGSIATITDCVFKNNQSIVNELGSGGNGGAMYITRSSKVTMKNCTFTDNKAASGAGAVGVYGSAQLKATGCDFTSNSAKTCGALYGSNNTKLTLTNINFTDNSAYMDELGAGGNCGALYMSNAEVSLDTLSFKGNTAANNAGAIYINNCDVVLDETCTFEDNMAGNHGGVIYTTYTTLEDGTKDGTVLTVNNVTFKNNTALSGGVISARTASELHLTDVRFVENTTPGAKVSTANGGGAIYSNNSTLYLTRVSFDGNSSGYYGGAMKLDACDTVITDSSLTNNSGGTGGAVYASAGTMVMDNITITGNDATRNGVLYLTTKEATLTNITASGNHAACGGVLNAARANVTLSDSKLTGNTASSGGAVYVSGNANVNIANVEFADNQTTSYGGAIYVIGATLNVEEGNTFTGNTANGNGGAIAAFDLQDVVTLEKTPSYVTITNVPFVNNTGACGGAVYFNDSVYTITGCSFTGNTATSASYGGGAVYNTGATGTIENVVFTGNTALNGGAMAMYTSSHVTVSNVTATENTATSTGGAFYSRNCQLDILPGTIVFTNNNANIGGAIGISNGNLDLQDAVLTGNTAATNGGAIQISCGTLTITGENTKISGNSAGNHGGAIYASYTTDSEGVKNGATLNISGVTLENNTALFGGAISGRTNTTFNLTDVVLKNNATPDATSDNEAGGGAIYTNNSVLNLTDVTFCGNASGYYGGAIYTEVVSAAMQDVTFESNVGGTGAVVYMTAGSSLKAENLTVINNTSNANGNLYFNGYGYEIENLVAYGNTSKWRGGVMYVSGSKTEVTVADSLLHDNTSGSGGAAYVAGGSLAVSETEIYNNTASVGGAAYVASGSLTVSESDVHDNSAKTGGAFAAINGSKLNIVDLTVKNNSATTGGAVSIQGAELTVSGQSVFTGNTTTGNGGAIHISDYAYKPNSTDETYTYVKASVSITGAVFENNTGARGGAVYVSGNEYTISDTTFTGNAATDFEYGGGAIYTTGGIGHLSNIVFTSNTSVKGGAVALHSLSEMYVSGMTAQGNTATANADGKVGHGGVFYVNNSTLVLNGTDAAAQLVSNSAVIGGAIHASNNSVVTLGNVLAQENTVTGSNGGAVYANNAQVTITESSMLSNTASVGGAIYITGGSLTMGNASFEKHVTTGVGGAIYANSCDVTMNNCAFTDNASGSNGGAIDFAGCTVTGSGNIFTGNTAGGHGGAIYVVYVEKTVDGVSQKIGTTMNLTGGSFSGNSALYGGAISGRTNSNITLYNVTLDGNNTSGATQASGGGGGAIYTNASTLTLDSCFIQNNTSGYYGGAIYTESTKVTLNESMISGNSGATGGALYLTSGSSLQSENCTVSGNTSRANGVIYLNGNDFNIEGMVAFDNSAARNGGVFYINGANSVVNITNSSFVNNTSVNGGVMLVVKGNVHLTDTAINGNTATNGGAIYAEAGVINVTGGTISNNTATEGGAIHVINAAQMTLTNTDLSGNTATSGGAVRVEGATLNVSGTSFSGNTTTGNGGAIHVGSYSYETEGENPETVIVNATVTIDGATFTGNTAAQGGAVYVTGNSYTISNSTFANNTATNAEYGGGAVYTTRSTGTMANVTFIGNSSVKGGAVALHSTSVLTVEGISATGNSAVVNADGKLGIGGVFYVNNATLTVIGADGFNSVSDNTAVTGGAINAANGATINISGITFSGNTSTGNGGAIYSNGADLQLADCVLSGNSGTNGGAVYITGADLTVSGSTFEGNTTTSGGAAAYINSSNVVLNNNTFNGNIAAGNGGAIFVVASEVTGADNIFTGNSAATHGGAIYVVYGTKNIDGVDTRIPTNMNLTGGSFENNTAIAGGAVSIRSACGVTFTDTSFIGNSVTGYVGENDGDGDGGGAIYVGYGTVTLNNVTATGNTAESYGGVIDAYRGVVNISGGQYSNNVAGIGGGVIYGANISEITIADAAFTGNKTTDPTVTNTIGGGVIQINGGTLSISGSEFDGNSSAYYGGAILAGECDVTITDTEFKNHSGKTGATLYFKSKCTANLTNVTLTDNISKGNGNIYVNACTLNMTNVTATGNTAIYGGVMYASNGSTVVSMTDCSFTGNSATKSGGVIYQSAGMTTIAGCTISGNSAADMGGVIYLEGGTVQVTDTSVSGNSAVNGGAIYAKAGTIQITGGSLNNNTATTGGAIHVINAAQMTLTNTELSGNTATSGGAARVEGATLNVSGTNFSGNTATGNGGAIHVGSYSYTTEGENPETVIVKATVTIDGASFTGNTAAQGAGIYVTQNAYTVTNSQFTNNTATAEGYGGAAIYTTGGNGTLENITLTGNTSVRGGAIALHTNSEMTITGLIASGNSAVANSTGGHGTGGTFYVNNSTLTLTGTEAMNVIENGIAVNGGAITAANGAKATITGMNFNGNAASSSGGAIFASVSDIVLNNNTFTSNTAGTNGGAINTAANHITGTDNVFTNNSAVNHGGAIYLTYSTISDVRVGAVVELTGGSFTGNTAMAGGAISIRTACSATLNGTVLTGNSVTGDDGTANGDGDGGGAIYVGYGAVTLNNVTATGNSAENFGGVIDAFSGDVTISGGQYSDNAAGIAGGVIYGANKSEIAISDAIFTGNKTTNTTVKNTYGGGVVHILNGTLNISGSTFDGNSTAYYGGVLIAGSSEVSIKDSVVKNTAGKTGAALYFKEKCTATLENVTLTDNTAKSNGVVYVNTGTLDLINVTATGNTAASGGVLYASNGSTVVNISGGTFTDNAATTSGGVIYLSSGTVNITGGEYLQNTAPTGGAIYNINGTLTIDGVSFTENEASGDLGGGAIALEGGSFTATGTNVFSGNTAENLGGAIYVVDYVTTSGSIYSATVNITDATFTGNTAISGGAIYAEAGVINVTGGSLSNNTATEGGAIHAVNAAQLTISDAKLENNTATTGAAIRVEGATLTVSNTAFNNNTATGFGGAIHVGSYSYTTEGENPETVIVKATVTIDGASFTGNTAAQGAGIYVTQNSYTVSNSQFTDNTATSESYGGAAVYTTGGNGTMTNVTFTGNSSVKGGAVALHTNSVLTIEGVNASGNTAVVNADGKQAVGGVFYVNNATLTVIGADGFNTISGNTAITGGAINAANGATVNISGISFSGNTATYGGAIYITGSDLTVSSSSFADNSASTGGAISSSSSVLTLADTSFEKNVTTGVGGAIYANDCDVTMNNCAFAENASGSNGGAIDFAGCTVTGSDNIFTNNTAVNHGGAIYVTYVDKTVDEATVRTGTALELTGGSFTGNTAMAGGAISIRSACSVTLNGTVLTGNSVTGDDGTANGDGEGGGAIYVGYGELTLNGVTMSDNTAEAYGGAINALASTVTISDSEFARNATNAGGAIYTSRSASVLTISKTAFTENSAVTKGGAILLDTGATVTVSDCTFTGNSVSGGDGGAIYVADSSSGGSNATTLNMTGSILKGNSASAKGGAISTDTSSANLVINVADCTFESNTSGAGGGAVEIMNANCNSADDPTAVTIVFTNCTFTSNTAGSTGGAIEIRAGSCAKIDGITATGNSSKNGGGVIYVTSNYSRLYLTGTVTISGNTASGGTFIYLYKTSSYTNPPAVYTTDSSTAAWYSEVGGNKTNVVFDLTTLP